MTLQLAHGAWTLAIDAALGGSVASFRRSGADIFRPAVPGADHPLMTGCFPLVPYANRIAGGRFRFAGEVQAVPRNVADQAHPLHGVGWLAEWQVVRSDGTSATLVHAHEGDTAWPWAYSAEQAFTLADDGLAITLAVTNQDSRSCPVSLGFHPYFETAGVTQLSFEAGSVWLADEEFLPTVEASADQLGDWRAGEHVVRERLIDNCYASWSGSATIARDDGDLLLTGDATPFLHLFTPPGRTFFCVEPTSAMPDAMNRGGALSLAPGETCAIAMRLTAA